MSSNFNKYIKDSNYCLFVCSQQVYPSHLVSCADYCGDYHPLLTGSSMLLHKVCNKSSAADE